MYIGLWLLSARHVSTSLHSPLYTWTLSLHLEKEGPGPSYEKGGHARGRADEQALSLSLSSRTLVTPYCKRIRPGRRITRAATFPPCVPSCADPSGLGHAATIYSSVQGPPGSKHRQHPKATKRSATSMQLRTKSFLKKI
jgi:hypothetical protein